MKNDEENILNEVWEMPMITTLKVNMDTENFYKDSYDGGDGNGYS